MRVKLITFRYSATIGGFDDSALSEFIRDKEVLSFREHFYSVNDVPHLTCVVSYQDPVISPRDLDAARQSERDAGGYQDSHRAPWRDRPDPASGLGEAERVLFNTAREWRARKAREEGVPPYVILTNRQLLEIVRRRPESLTDLGHVDRVGASKLKHYGREILALLHGSGVHGSGAGPAEAPRPGGLEPEDREPPDRGPQERCAVERPALEAAQPQEVGP